MSNAIRYGDDPFAADERRHRGVVCHFNREKHFGFIRPDADIGADCFFGARTMAESGLTDDDIRRGVVVAFDYHPAKNGKGPSAFNLKIVD